MKMKQKTCERIISFALATIMAFTTIPVGAFAQESSVVPTDTVSSADNAANSTTPNEPTSVPPVSVPSEPASSESVSTPPVSVPPVSVPPASVPPESIPSAPIESAPGEPAIACTCLALCAEGSINTECAVCKDSFDKCEFAETALMVEESSYPILVNKVSAKIIDGVFTQVDYYAPIELSLDRGSSTNTVNFVYQPYTDETVDKEWVSWTSGLSPGKYYLGYDIEGDTVQDTSRTYGIEIVPATLKAPENLTWSNGTTASWDAVTTDAKGNALKDGTVAGYELAIYKDEAATPVAIKTVESAATTHDFADMLTDAGVYTFTAKALAKTETPVCYNHSDVSQKSSATRAVAVTLKAGTGIASVTPPEVLVLISGGKPSGNITATPKAQFTFATWECPEGITAATKTDSTTTFQIAAGYTGGTAAEVTATAATTVVPTVERYEAGSGKLTATAKDTVSGVTAYAFSTAAEASGVSDWNTVTSPKPDEIASFEHTIAAPGKYFFYAKNEFGNVAKSDAFIQATQVVYKGYGTVSDRIEYLLGGNTLTLGEPERPGFTFGGWYSTAETEGTALTELNKEQHSDAPIMLYAKWTKIPITITQQPAALNLTYDGNPHTISAAIFNTAGTITYQWFKNDNKIDGATKSTYSVKNVADSGTYHVAISVTVEGTTETATSNKATVTIEKAKLTVKADNLTIDRGAAPPTYTASYTPLLGTDTAAAVTPGSFTCDYQQGGKAGGYDIVPSGFAALNYEIIHEKGILTVKPTEVTAAITATLSQTVYTYTGEACKPAVTVKDGDKTLTEEDYTVVYQANTNVGTATASVVFKNNYKGKIDLSFQIEQASFTPTVSLTGWTYGETANEPQVHNNASGGELTYHYRASDGTDLPQKPTNAGTYKVYADIAATQNYTAAQTAEVSFTIAKCPITLTAPSRTWSYDGNSHSDTAYTMTGKLVGSDSFQSIEVKGQITDVGTVENIIQYTLAASTKAENYHITTQNGTLSITAQTLTVPVNPQWASSTPGQAAWIAVARNDLEVQYRATLYRAGKDGAKDVLVSTETAVSNEYSFKDAIKNDTAANGPASYYFTVQAIPFGGANKANYTSSNVSAHSETLHTVQVVIQKTTGIAGVTIDTQPVEQAVLLQGESVAIEATVETGYAFPGNDIWQMTAGAALSFGDRDKAKTTLKVLPSITKPASVELWANAEDEQPVIKAFTAQANDAYNQVTFTLHAQDTKGITDWAITTESTAPTTWTSVSSTTDLTATMDTAAANTYYAWIKDDNGAVVRSAAPISLYEIKFSGGDGVGVQIPSMLKVQNTTLKLPKNTYTKVGYSFKNWLGNTTGIYADEGNYAANAGDTLTAQWSNEQFIYTVNYFFMEPDGTYKAAPNSTSSFIATHGTTISTDNPAIQVSRTGMTLDNSDGKTGSITVTESGKFLNVYYARSAYTITYSYQEPGKTGLTTATETYRYGAAVADHEKPTLEGYTFVGWLYGEAGQKPATMPNKDITATGTFSANQTSYIIHYYEQDLQEANQSGEATYQYTLNSALTETKNALHAQTLTFSTDAADANAKIIPGFSVQGITVTQGKAGDSVLTTPPGAASAQGTVSAIDANKLYVNYYYTRNKYTLTLNVWKGSRDATPEKKNHLYKKDWTLAYGAAITAEDANNYANFDKEAWSAFPNDVSGYNLAEYVDWSTGDAPTTMPAGNITVSRDYVSSTTSSYQMDIFYEDENGVYQPTASLTYYANVGEKVTVGAGDGFTIDYTKFGSSLAGFNSYLFVEGHIENVTEGIVTDIGGDGDKSPLVLKLHFERKQSTSQIRYYYNDGISNAQVLIGTLKKSGKWGTTYNHEPLLLFSGSGVPPEWQTYYTSSNQTINDAPAENFDFKTNGYVVSYAGYYTMDGKENWPGKRFLTVEDLSKTYEGVLGNGWNNKDESTDYINVYYTKVERANTYALDVVYNPKGLNNGKDDPIMPLTVTIGEQTYRVRVANKIDVFEFTCTQTDLEGYPGAADLNGTYTYDALKPGFTEVTLPKGGKYYTTNIDGQNYLYVIDEKNQFILGNRTSYNFLTDSLNPDRAGYDSVEAYFAQYKNDHGNSDNPTDYDDAIAGAFIRNSGFSSIVFNKTNPINYQFSFDYTETYQVTYNLGGTTCTDKLHIFADNATVTPGCTHPIFQAKDGYSIVWYKDGEYKTPAETFNIKGDTTLYGRYERNTLVTHEYVHYQLADALTVDGKEIFYVTADNLSAVKSQLGDALVATSEEAPADFTDGAGNKTDHTIKTTIYTYRDQTVLMDKSYPILTFTQIKMEKPEDKNGFHYDTTNTDNRQLGFCQTEAVPLAVYFARNEHAVTMVPNNAKVSNSITTNYRFGQTVSLADPTKGGYTFAGWNWYQSSAGEGTDDASANWVQWADSSLAGEDGKTPFAMPALRLKAEAKWTPANFGQTITHYFQGSTQTYDTELVKSLSGKPGTTASVTFEDTVYPATVYASGSTVLGLSLPLSLGGKPYTAWFSGASIPSGDAITVEASDLIALEEKTTLTSEVKTRVSDYQLPEASFDMFRYSFTIYQADTEVTTLNASGEFTNQYDMQVNYYYIRQSDYTIRIVAKAQDGGAPGATVTGDSRHYYGEQVTLTANLPSGYDMVGWYLASDALTDYTPGMENWTACALKSKLPASPLSKELNYQMLVKDGVDLVVVTTPQAITLPTVTISGQNSYTYGYAASPNNALTANVTGVADDTSIAGYQWYDQSGTPIENATSSTYLFPTGQTAGTYAYKCIIKIGRKDNGREAAVATAPYSVTVSRAAMEMEASNYKATYDGQAHGISVKVKTPAALDSPATYEIYYAQQELTADNYSTIGSTTPITYTDFTGGAKTVYYYVHSTDGNYIDVGGQQTVTINPITLTAKANAKPYTKGYDGKPEIDGDVTQAGTGKYRLAHDGYYTVSGMIADAAVNYLLDFSANFNDKNVFGASTVTLSNLRVVDEAGNANGNYTFTPDSTIVIPGYITPFPLNVSWSVNNTFSYDGTLYAPTVTLAENQVTPEAVALSVTGGQRNVGGYTAYAAVTPSASGAYETSNYSFGANASCLFTITQRALTITPNDKTVTYDKTPQTLDTFTTSGLIDGQTCTARPNMSATDAGTYGEVTAENVQITAADGKVITYNYAISYGKGTLLIQPKKVTIGGITAADKIYDGNTAATLNLSGAVFTGLIEGDTLTLDESKITGSFDNANAATDKTVSLTNLQGLLTGASAANYTLDWANGQTSTTADITAADILVTATSVTTVYGETAPFAVEYAKPDGITVTGEPAYNVRKSGTTDAFEAYVPGKHGVGTYDIKPDVSGMHADNYRFVVSASPATLTVTKRPVVVQAKPGTKLTKVYDAAAVATTLVTPEHYEFVGIADDPKSGLFAPDTLALQAGYAAAYNSKDVGTATTVTMSGLAIKNDNYELKNAEFTINGEITAKPLTVTAVDKSILYGATAPGYTVRYDGFATGESQADLTGNLVVTGAYDTSVADHRKVGPYSIKPSGYANGNYAITYVDGKLTVNKAVIRVTADSLTHVYRGTESLPTYTGKLTGFQYEETESAVVTGSAAYTCAATLASEAGKYEITPNISDLKAENYTFQAVKGTLTVERNIITISNIAVKDKKYDGTNQVALSNIDLSGVQYDGIKPADDVEGNQGAKAIQSITATYGDPAVGNGKEVTLAITLNAYLSARYGLHETSQKSATASITEQALTVTANNKTIQYGAAAPTYTAAYTGFVNGETAKDLSGTLVLESTYSTGSDTGTYPITPRGYTSANYTITHTPGILTVTQAKLAAPTVTWSTENPGTVTWTAPSKIGNVDVDHYKLELFKNGNTTAVHSLNLAASSERSCDLLETIRTNGAGAYTVKVTAIASTAAGVNDANKNVADSNAGTSAAIYAAQVSIAFAADEFSQAGCKDTAAPTIKGAAAYVAVAGEKALPIIATLVNATGYTVRSAAANHAAVTVTDAALSGTGYTANAAVGTALNSANPITITLTLSATPATLALTVVSDETEVTYGYSVAPKLEVTAVPADDDNLPQSNYTYTYQWKLKQGVSGGAAANIDGAIGKELTFPMAKPVGNYSVSCEVTATRTDNQQTKILTSSPATKITVKRSSFSSDVILNGWTYGDARGVPAVSSNPENRPVTYEYSANETITETTIWSPDMPTNAGSYWVRAKIAEGTNHAAVTTVPIAFTIAQAKLAAPQSLTMAPSATAPYGKATWAAVSGPKENGNSATPVGVSYEVKLYRAESEAMPELVKTVQTGDLVCDFTAEISRAGTYTFTVTAISADQTNCADSDVSAASDALSISATIDAPDGVFTKPYDGVGIVLTASYTGANPTGYQWYLNDKPIDGATEATYPVIYIEQNGNYSCNVMVDGTGSSSTHQQVTITKRPITVTSPPATKVYDGTPLTDNHWVQSGAVSGETVTCALNASITAVGSTPNTIGDVKIMAREKDVTSNYTVTRTHGTLSVTAKPLGAEGITVSDPTSKTYDGTPQTQTVTVTDGASNRLAEGTDYTVEYESNLHAGTAKMIVTGSGNYGGEVEKTFTITQRSLTVASENITKDYNGTEWKSAGVSALTATGLAADDKLTSVIFTAARTDEGSTANTFGTLVIQNKGGEDVTADYAITPVYGKITVNPISSAAAIVGSPEKTYDGTPVSDPQVSKLGTGTVSIHYYTKSGETYTELTEAPKDAGTYYVKANVTASLNYSASASDYLAFTIAPRAITITPDDKSSMYGEPLVPLTYTTVPALIAVDEALDIQAETTAQSTSSKGPYPITVKTNAEASRNYTITANKGTYTITEAAMTVTASGYTGVYDGAAHGISVSAPAGATVKYRTASTGDYDLTENPTYTDVGTYTVYYCVSAPNYADVSGSQTVTIDKAEQTITVEHVTAVYDGKAHSITGATASGGGTITYSGNNPITVGTHTVTIYAAATANHNEASGTATVTISARPITIRANDGKKVYDGSALTVGTYTVAKATPPADGDAVVSATVTGSQTDVGTSDNIPSAAVIKAGEDDRTANYAVTYEKGVLEVTQSVDTVTLSGNLDKPYDGTPVSDPQVSKLGTGTVSIHYYTKSGETYTELTEAPKDAGTYYVKANVTASLNYSASASDYLAFTIAPRAITITLDDKSSMYGQPLVPLTYTTVPALIAVDEALDIQAETTAQSTSSKGPYPITVKTNAEASRNYTITANKGTYTITEAAMTVTASGYTGVYDGAAHGISVSAPAGATVKYRTAATGDYDLTENPTYTDVGTYTVYYCVSAPNYADVSGSQTVTIDKAEQTITVEHVTAVYDGKAHSITGATASGGGTITYSGNGPITVGTHTVTIHAAATANHNEASGTATVTISARPITIRANDGKKVYDGSALTVDTYTVAKATPPADGDAVVSATVTGSQTDVGTSDNIPSAAVIKAGEDDRTANYAVTYEKGVLEVTKATQSAPTDLIGYNETIETKGDGSIGGIQIGMEYRKSGETAYTAVTAQMVLSGKIPALAGGVYEVRYAENQNYTASKSAQITIGFEKAAVYALKLAVPTFADVTEGYTQPQAQPLTITSASNVDTAIAAVTSSDTNVFRVTGSGASVAAGDTLTSYAVSPVSGLAAGTYKSDITVTYHNGKTVTGQVSLLVKPKPVSPPPSDGSNTGTDDSSSSQPSSGSSSSSSNTSSSNSNASSSNSDASSSNSGASSSNSDASSSNSDASSSNSGASNSNSGASSPNATQSQATSDPSGTTPDASSNAGQSSVPTSDTKNFVLEDKKVIQKENLSYGSGNIHVTVDCLETEQRRVEAALVSSQQVVDACLTEQEKQAVVDGNSIEIRLTVKLNEKEVPETDAKLITRQVDELQSKISGLTLGEYVDIKLDKRFNNSEWESITQTQEDIAIEISIPGWLQFPNTDYFISRAHNGEVHLLEDIDDVPETITVPTQYFSTYAILYTTAAAKPYCVWHFLILIVLVGYLLLIFIGKRKTRKQYGLFLAAAILLFVLAAVLGWCALDWPIALLSTVAAIAAVPLRKRLTEKEETQ